MSSDALEVFQLLNKNEVGSTRAAFYEAHAIVLESQGKYQEANRVYEKGISMYASSFVKIN